MTYQQAVEARELLISTLMRIPGVTEVNVERHSETGEFMLAIYANSGACINDVVKKLSVSELDYSVTVIRPLSNLEASNQ